MNTPETQSGGSMEPVGSETCFDCGVTLTAANRTNRDNALDADENPRPICDDCCEERWKNFMREDEQSRTPK